MFRHCYVILYEFFPALHLNDDFIFSRKARTREAIDWIVSFLPSVVPPMSVCPVQISRGQVSLCEGWPHLSLGQRERAADPKRGEPRLAGSECPLWLGWPVSRVKHCQHDLPGSE